MPTPLIPQEIYMLERYSSKDYYLHAGRGGANVANVDAERLGAASPRAAGRQTLNRMTRPFKSIARRDRSWLAALV